MKVDEFNASVCCCPIMEYVANASEPGIVREYNIGIVENTKIFRPSLNTKML